MAKLSTGLIEAISDRRAGSSCRDPDHGGRGSGGSARTLTRGMVDLMPVYARLASHPYQSWYAIPLRLVVGCGFMEHGYAKIARGPEKYASILHALGVPAPDLLAWATILVELLGGLAVLLGMFIPLASIPMAIILLVAIFTVHVPNGFSSIKLLSVDAAGAHFGQPGYETALLYLAALAALVLGGSGPLALDRFLLDPRRRQ